MLKLGEPNTGKQLPRGLLLAIYANHIIQSNEAIPVRIRERSQTSNRQKNSHDNHANVIHIPTITQNIHANTGRRTMLGLPGFYLLNARSLLPKNDEQLFCLPTT
jgi:hypothetical protein